MTKRKPTKVARPKARPSLSAQDGALELLARRLLDIEQRVGRLEVVARRAAVEGQAVDVPA